MVGVVGWVSMPSSEKAWVLMDDSGGDWLSCEVLSDNSLVREGSSGIGSLGCEVSVTGRGCVLCAVATLSEGRMVRVVFAGPEYECMLVYVDMTSEQHRVEGKNTRYSYRVASRWIWQHYGMI